MAGRSATAAPAAASAATQGRAGGSSPCPPVVWEGSLPAAAEAGSEDPAPADRLRGAGSMKPALYTPWASSAPGAATEPALPSPGLGSGFTWMDWGLLRGRLHPGPRAQGSRVLGRVALGMGRKREEYRGRQQGQKDEDAAGFHGAPPLRRSFLPVHML